MSGMKASHSESSSSSSLVDSGSSIGPHLDTGNDGRPGSRADEVGSVIGKSVSAHEGAGQANGDGAFNASTSTAVPPVAVHPGQKRVPIIGISIRWLVLIFLVVQNSAAALFMRSSRAAGGPKEWNSQTGVIMQEVIKGTACIFLLGSWAEIRGAFENRGELLRTSVPALLYLVQNNMQYVAVSHLDAPTYAVLYQLKILTTAVLSATILGKTITATQWFALCVLTAGVSMVTLSQLDLDGKNVDGSQGNIVIGFTAVLTAAAVSGLAGVYFEMILKGSTVSLWQRNLQMALYSVFIGIGGLIAGGDMPAVIENGFFYGYTTSAWLAITNNALGGLLIAMVIKFADNILKNFSQSLSIIFTALASWYLFGSSISVLFGFGVACVLYAIGLYGGVMSIPIPPMCASKSSEQTS